MRLRSAAAGGLSCIGSLDRQAAIIVVHQGSHCRTGTAAATHTKPHMRVQLQLYTSVATAIHGRIGEELQPQLYVSAAAGRRPCATAMHVVHGSNRGTLLGAYREPVNCGRSDS